MSKHTVIRYHDFCAGHTVTGHESKCAHLHGHNYRATFHVQIKNKVGKPDCIHCDGTGIYYQIEGRDCFCLKEVRLDNVGRVVDFSVVKATLCEWLEVNWDHKFLINKDDPRLNMLLDADGDSLVICDFNPTAENMAQYLVEVVAPQVLALTDVELVGIELSETRKCSVSYFKD